MKPSIAITEWSEILANQSDEAIIDFVAAPFHEKIYQDQSFDLLDLSYQLVQLKFDVQLPFDILEEEPGENTEELIFAFKEILEKIGDSTSIE